jgi:hypothetical protein
MVAIFIESTSMHEKPETAHVMEDGGAERLRHSLTKSMFHLTENGNGLSF